MLLTMVTMNKETIADLNRERSQKYYAKHRERLMERIYCECGQLVTRGGLADHKKRSRHRNNMIRIEFMKLKDSCTKCPQVLMAETVET